MHDVFGIGIMNLMRVLNKRNFVLRLQVIQACHSCPKAIEVVVNAYEHIRWNGKWKRAIPDDDLEVKHLCPSSGFPCKVLPDCKGSAENPS